MSGSRRIVVGNITQGNLRGKALGDALYNSLRNEQTADGNAVKKTLAMPKKKNYGKKK